MIVMIIFFVELENDDSVFDVEFNFKWKVYI